ncbi:unnamed protein product, partial [Menidia menidia]
MLDILLLMFFAIMGLVFLSYIIYILIRLGNAGSACTVAVIRLSRIPGVHYGHWVNDLAQAMMWDVKSTEGNEWRGRANLFPSLLHPQCHPILMFSSLTRGAVLLQKAVEREQDAGGLEDEFMPTKGCHK